MVPPRSTLYPLPASPRTMVPALVKLTPRSTQLLSPAMVISWSAATPGWSPVPVSGYGGQPGQLIVNFAGPALRSSSRPPALRTTGLPNSLPPRWKKWPPLWLKAPLFVTDPPWLMKEPPLEKANAAPVSTMKVPLFVVVYRLEPKPSTRVSDAATSTVPPAAFVMLTRR